VENRIALIAGNGRFPILFAQEARKKGVSVVAIAIKEESRTLSGPKLFYDINQKQTYIKTEDIIDLEKILHPTSPIVRANELLEKLNKNGVLKNKIKFKPWQSERIKRVSLISYSGIKDIFDETKKTYKIFYEAYKRQAKIQSYTDFCYILINNYLSAITSLVKERYKSEFNKISNDLLLKSYYLLC